MTFLMSKSALAAALVAVSTFVGSFLAYQVHNGLYQATSVSLNLQDGDTEVPLEQKLVFHLSRPAPIANVEKGIQLTPPVQGKLAAAENQTLFTWTPRAAWADQTRYKVSFSAIKDSGGQRVTPAQWTFTTTLVPRVVALTGADGNAVVDGAQLPAGSALKVVFNTPMDPGSVRVLANGQPVDPKWADDGISAGIGIGAKQSGPVQFSLGPGGHDRRGHPLAPSWGVKVTISSKAEPPPLGLRHPALFQVSNDIGARDQSGLQSADMVFEYLTEAGIPRFTAVFTRAPDTVGPIESGRYISLALTRHLHGELFATSLTRAAATRLRANPVPSYIGLGGFFFRAGPHLAPDNVFIRGSSIEQQEKASSTPEFVLHAGTPQFAGAQTGTAVTVPELYSTYTFEPASGSYLKTEPIGGARQLGDTLTGQPLRMRMVIVLHAREAVSSEVDGNGVHSVDYDLDSGGRAEFYFQGQKQSGRWSAADSASPFTYQLDDGRQLDLPAGLVWIEVVR